MRSQIHFGKRISPCNSVESPCLCGENVQKKINHRDTEIAQRTTETVFPQTGRALVRDYIQLAFNGTYRLSCAVARKMRKEVARRSHP